MTELRDVVADGMRSTAQTWPKSYEEIADVVIRAIEASGRVTVDRARFERLLDAANMAADEWGAESRVGLQQGDLEPLP